MKCWCLQGIGDAWLEIVCAGGEAELSLAAGDGADPWQGGIGGAA